jgi:hypothetical protein
VGADTGSLCVQEASDLPPARTQEEWRPDALLCRLLNVPDPFRGKPKPAAGHSLGADYLGVPPSERGATFAAQLPTGFRPGLSSDPGRLPPPPPRPGPIGRPSNSQMFSHDSMAVSTPAAASTPAPLGSDIAAAQAAEALLASLTAEPVRLGTC